MLFSIPIRNEKRSLKIKWKTLVFNEYGIPLINQDEEYDDYGTPDTTPSRVDETLFTVPDTAEATLTLRLRQKLKRDKTVSLYRYLGMTGDPSLADLDRFNFKKIRKLVMLNCFLLMLIDIDNLLPTNELVSF